MPDGIYERKGKSAVKPKKGSKHLELTSEHSSSSDDETASGSSAEEARKGYRPMVDVLSLCHVAYSHYWQTSDLSTAKGKHKQAYGKSQARMQRVQSITILPLGPAKNDKVSPSSLSHTYIALLSYLLG